MLTGELSAGAIYTIGTKWFFPSGTQQDYISAPLTPGTVDSHTTDFSTNPGNPTDNHLIGTASLTGNPFEMSLQSSLTIGQATSGSGCCLSGVTAGIDESGVTVTGGSGTGYLLPTFQVQGTLNDGNSSIRESVDICAGNNTCLLATPAATMGGTQNVNFLFTPGMTTDTAFTFGTPFDFFFFYEIFNDLTGVQANPGGPVTADFTNGLRLISIQVVNVDGQPIPGAVIHSDFLNTVGAPEPGSLIFCGGGLLLTFGLFLRTKG